MNQPYNNQKMDKLEDLAYACYQVTMQIYHGTRPITNGLPTDFLVKTETDFYDIVKYDKWLESKAVRICNLPREARLVFSLYGRRTVTQKETVKKELTELGWGALQLFNFEKYLGSDSIEKKSFSLSFSLKNGLRFFF